MADDKLASEGYERALKLLVRCATDHGFLASPSSVANYRRIWGRDGVVLGLAALMTGDDSLRDTFRRTLVTLAENQGPHGEIPSNVDTESGRISYGGTTGRVDADLWFLIGCGEYAEATGDTEPIRRLWRAIERVEFLLGAWEFNNRGLLYVPQTGDWSDEYIYSGYVLYDQLLYLQAMAGIRRLRQSLWGDEDPELGGRMQRLEAMIKTNYWFNEESHIPQTAYHEVLYRKGRAAAPRRQGMFWLPSFSPSGYGYRFDGFANVLVSLMGVADDAQRRHVDDYIASVAPQSLPLLPAYYPVIEPIDTDWKELSTTFSYTFKNNPYEYQNGGLWPFITGFYVADLAHRNRREAAERHLRAIHAANRMAMHEEDWGFPEYVHGKKLEPGGTAYQGWSAAAAVIGHHALQGAPLFRIAAFSDKLRS